MRIVLLVLISISAQAQSLETIIQQGHELAVVTVAVSPDSNYIATGSKDKSARLWERATGREVRSFLGHEATVTGVVFADNGKYLITGSNDKSIRLWEVANGREIAVIRTTDIITDIAVDPNQNFLSLRDTAIPDMVTLQRSMICTQEKLLKSCLHRPTRVWVVALMLL